MIHSISWSVFLETIFISTVLYYGVILALFYREEVWSYLRSKYGKV